MATQIYILLSLFTLTLKADAQFFDLFQSFQPFLQNGPTTKSYNFLADFGFNPNDANHRRNEAQTNGQKPPISVIGDDRIIKDNVRTTLKPKRKSTTAPYNLDHTTAKPIRKVNKDGSSRRNTQSNRNKNHGLVTDRRQYYDDTANSVDYTDRSTVRNHVTTRRNYVTANPVTAKPYNANYNTFTSRPGVKPANVDTNRPPITNRPPTARPFAVYPIATDSSAIRYPEDPDTSPEVLVGIDEDQMSSAERRRYISLAEKMCDKYKSFDIQRVEAIPLLPSPEPVRVNVSVCSPTTVPLVVGGKVVGIEEFPHMALLGWTKIQKSGYSWKCGGSLVSEQFVLTAGHCASQEKDETVVTGAPRVVQLGSSYMDDTGALVVKVLSVVKHPKYARPKSYYDIALVKLVKPVTFSEVIRPACLGEPPGVGEPVIVTGWGRTEFSGALSQELRSVSVPIWDMDECREVLGVSRKMPNGPSRDSQICAGEKPGGKDACQGDSGGPAQIQDGCVWRVVAVTSIGRSCGAPNTPGLYARVQKAFIAAQIFGKSSTTTIQNNPQTTNVNYPRNTNSRPNNGQPNRNSNNNRPSNNNQNNWNTNSQGNVNNNNWQANTGSNQNNGQPNSNNNNNQNTWNSHNQENVYNNNRPGGSTGNSQGSWNSNTQANFNNNRPNGNTNINGANRNSNNQASISNNNNRRDVSSNNNQGSWNTNTQPDTYNRHDSANNNQGLWNTKKPSTQRPTNNHNSWNNANVNNNNNWNQPNSNNGNWNRGYENSNNRGQIDDPYAIVDNRNTYNSGSYNRKPEDYGNNKREYNYNDDKGGDDDYYDSNREGRNNYRSSYVTTKRPIFNWSNFGF